MKTSFSVNVTGSINVSIEPSNEDGGGAAVDIVLVDVLLKSLIDAIKKYAGDKGTPTIEEEDISSPLPQRRVPLDSDAAADDDDDDDTVDPDASNDDDDDDASTVDPDAASNDDDEDEDQVSDLLPNVEIDNEYEEDYQLSQKMGLMSLRRRD